MRENVNKRLCREDVTNNRKTDIETIRAQGVLPRASEQRGAQYEREKTVASAW